MTPDRIAVAGVTGLAVLLVVAALWQVGGPQAGRMEARDDTRFSDLLSLTSLVTCKATTEGNALPQDLTESASCRYDVRLNDPYTDAPYRYEIVDTEEYRICADFERPERLTGRAQSFDAEEGCLYQQVALDP